MKIKTILVVAILLALIISCRGIAIASETPEIEPTEVIAPEMTPTVKEEIARLSAKYKQPETLAIAIIQCESEFIPDAKHTNSTSSVDYSYWQINDYWHRKDAKKAGYDIENPEDNLEYGFIMLKRDGTRHWKASKNCWTKLLKNNA